MHVSPHSRDRGTGFFPVVSIGPRTWTALTGCAVVSTGYALGASWLSAGILGVPLGLWLVAGATYATHRVARRTPATTASTDATPGATAQGWIGPAAGAHTDAPLPLPAPASIAASHAADVVNAAQRGVAAAWKAVSSARRELTAAADVLTGQTERLRIALDVPAPDALALERAAESEVFAGLDVRFVRAGAEAGEVDATLVRSPAGEYRLNVPERSDKPAAWSDWAEPLPLGYPGVFTPRVDCRTLGLDDLDLHDDEHAQSAVRAAVVVALLGRTPARAEGGGRLTGRPAIDATQTPGGVLEQAMLRLGSSLEAFTVLRDAPPPRFARTIARAVGAWLTTWPGEFPSGVRGKLAAACDTLLPGEGESELRLAAVQISEMHDADGCGSLLRAARTLKRRSSPCAIDPLPFVMAEAELGTPNGLTLGRIAAGVALLWATSPGESLSYLRDDLLDDLRHAGWLEERDQDLNLLSQLMADLDVTLGHTSARPRNRRAAA